MQTFADEAQEQLAVMEQGMVGIEHRPNDPELLASIFRAAHTLKGNAAIVGLTAVADRAHEIEDMLERLRAGTTVVTPELVNGVLASLDGLRQALAAGVSEDSEP